MTEVTTTSHITAKFLQGIVEDFNAQKDEEDFKRADLVVEERLKYFLQLAKEGKPSAEIPGGTHYYAVKKLEELGFDRDSSDGSFFRWNTKYE